MKRLLLAVLTMTMLAALTSAASAASESKSLQDRVVLYQDATMTIVQDGDWTRWEFVAPLTDSTTHVYRGERNPAGGCDFTVIDANRNQAPEGFVSLEREIAQDLASCVSVTERAFVPANSVTEKFAMESTQEFFPGDEIGGLGAASSGSKTVWLKVVYEDPIWIDVTSVKSTVSFSYDGSCVTGSWNHRGDWGWFAGWSITSNGGQAAQNCSYAATQSYGHYTNDVFCPGGGNTTHNNYYSVTVYGEENGTQTNSYSTTKSGGCAFMLRRDVLSS